MPAAAVIPAPIAYIKVVAVKTLVVEILLMRMSCLSENVLIIIGIGPKRLSANPDKCSELLL